jgi:hypothetical protein
VTRRQRRPIFDDRSRALDRFGLLLVVAVASIVILMLVNIGPRVTDTSGRWESALASALVGSTLLLALRASGLSLRLQRVADLIVVLVVGGVTSLAVASMFNDSIPLPSTAAPFLLVLLALLAPLAVVRRLLQHREVTRGTLLGAVSGYLLLPIAFFYAFLSISVSSGPVFGEILPTQSYMYFSLTTITTTGYGDLTAQTDVGRTLAMAEAVIGQIYLVTFVAMLVGLFIAGRRTLREPLIEPGPQPGAEES